MVKRAAQRVTGAVHGMTSRRRRGWLVFPWWIQSHWCKWRAAVLLHFMVSSSFGKVCNFLRNNEKCYHPSCLLFSLSKLLETNMQVWVQLLAKMRRFVWLCDDINEILLHFTHFCGFHEAICPESKHLDVHTHKMMLVPEANWQSPSLLACRSNEIVLEMVEINDIILRTHN